MPLWCRLRLTWSTFRFRSRDACMTKLGIMTDENTTSQQTQPTEAATEAAAETATDTDAQQQDQGAQSAAESAAPVDFEPLTATYERLRHSTDPAELSEFARRPLPDRADQAAFSRATALLEAVAGNPHTPVADRVFLADTMPFPNVLVKLSEDPEPSVRQAVAANGDDKNWLVGRLTKDPELRRAGEISVCSFRIACDRNFARQGEQRQADFIDIVAWKGQAEFVSKYFQKGSMIVVEGALQTRNYEDRNGNKRTAVEVVARTINFGGPKNSGSSSSNSEDYHSNQASYDEPAAPDTAEADDFAVIDDSEDLPF